MTGMTVQELIDELERIPKQSRHKPIIMTEYDGDYGIISTYTVWYIYNNEGVYELKKKFIKSQAVVVFRKGDFNTKVSTIDTKGKQL